ncbi:MAG TPA: FAD-dependent oxidoreductase [Candidatus Polarisedimenticolia bacterium]|nr:FAD-dependent oxidoreductase [Candidatus Polarisedimenticolia bacterium]
MSGSKYLIIGGGMTAAAAIEGIRERDTAGSIAVIGADPHPPYNRPPLSKALWKGKPLESIWRKSDGPGITLHLGHKATRIDAARHEVTDDGGRTHTYEKLLLATGAAPRRLPFGDDGVVYYRTLDDYQRLRGMAGAGKRIAVIGGGFIGSEIAAALAMNDTRVTLVFPDAGIAGRIFPADLSMFLNGYYGEKGVEVVAGASVTGLEKRGAGSTLTLRAGKTGPERSIEVDGVVAGIGVQPNVDLARAAGLAVESGIRVDASLRASHPDIFAAGDVAEFHNPVLDRFMRVEHEDNANTMGALAGRAMTGETVSYDHLPSFYSDLFDLGYEAVGDLDARLTTVADWKEPFREGVVYYVKDGRVRGVLLWNVWEQVDAARRLLAEPGPFSPANLKGRLPA